MKDQFNALVYTNAAVLNELRRSEFELQSTAIHQHQCPPPLNHPQHPSLCTFSSEFPIPYWYEKKDCSFLSNLYAYKQILSSLDKQFYQ
jgi:hypothetical protein